MIDLTLGILTYNAPKTLQRTLESIFCNDVNTFFNEIIAYINPSNNTDENKNILDSFNIKYHLADENKWIGPGFKWLVENSNSSSVLLLEDDFFLIEKDDKKVFNILKSSVDLLKEGDVDTVKLRSRRHAGNPLYSSWLAGQEHRCMTHLGDCVHWKENPDIDFPDHCKKISEDPVWYKFKSSVANFTNNPCIYKKDFYKENIFQFCTDNSNIEDTATPWWSNQSFNVIIGDGLFCHDRLDGK
jgi:hypothetical protein